MTASATPENYTTLTDVTFLQTVERIASQKFLRDLTLKLDAVRSIPRP